MEYRQTITVKKELLDEVNRLLKIEDMEEELTFEELLVHQFDSIDIADNVVFENGKTIYIGISSGDRFYYDECCFLNDEEDEYEPLHFDFDKPIENELKIYHEYTDDVYIVDIIIEE